MFKSRDPAFREASLGFRVYGFGFAIGGLESGD